MPRLHQLESLAAKLEKHVVLLFLGFTALYAVTTYFLHDRKYLWADELYTYYIAVLPTMTDVWGALMSGGDQMTPFFYLATRASVNLFGPSAFALRFPHMLGFWVMSLCLLIYVGRRTSYLYGLLAAIFPLLTNAFYFSYEARPYGLMLGFGSLALVCWQSATMNTLRWLSIIFLALSLAGAISVHYYGIFILFPIALGEAVRTLRRRRLDTPIWIAFVLSVLPLFWYLPLIQQVRANTGIFWAKVAWSSIIYFYYNLLYEANIPIVIILFLTGIYFALDRDKASSQNPSNDAVPPMHEVVAAAGFILIPIICVAIGKFITHAFAERYALAAIIGFSIIISFIIAKLFKNNALISAALLGCFVVWFGLSNKNILSSSELLIKNEVDLIQKESDPNLPIVAAELHTFIELMHYAAPEITSRLSYPANPAISLKRLEHDSVDRGAIDLVKPWFGMNVTDYRNYINSTDRFYVYGKFGILNWIIPQLKEDGMHLEMLSTDGTKFLFLVYRQEQSRDLQGQVNDNVATVPSQ